ncbi:MAG TPA: MBL fold metallo-hydrolase [Acidimicrobiia bacterium]|nr:MBL fold metallo-hydrolase [Acidimicrobiia bacterium]
MVKIERVLAPNPGPFTGDGTNTWVLEGQSGVWVIDPGPVIDPHRQAIIDTVAERRPLGVLVTHTHSDHAPLANPLAREWQVPAIGYSPGPDFDPDRLVGEGDQLSLGDELLTVLHTPGHADDHLCFLVGKVLFTGDHIIGGSSVMIEDLTAYLDSLEKLRDLDLERLLPGHGPEMDRPWEVIDWYLAHRRQREEEILAAIAAGAGSVEEVVEVVYAGVDRSLHPLAARSVMAHLAKLDVEGRLPASFSRL